MVNVVVHAGEFRIWWPYLLDRLFCKRRCDLGFAEEMPCRWDAPLEFAVLGDHIFGNCFLAHPEAVFAREVPELPIPGHLLAGVPSSDVQKTQVSCRVV